MELMKACVGAGKPVDFFLFSDYFFLFLGRSGCHAVISLHSDSPAYAARLTGRRIKALTRWGAADKHSIIQHSKTRQTGSQSERVFFAFLSMFICLCWGGGERGVCARVFCRNSWRTVFFLHKYCDNRCPSRPSPCLLFLVHLPSSPSLPSSLPLFLPHLTQIVPYKGAENLVTYENAFNKTDLSLRLSFFSISLFTLIDQGRLVASEPHLFRNKEWPQRHFFLCV